MCCASHCKVMAEVQMLCWPCMWVHMIPLKPFCEKVHFCQQVVPVYYYNDETNKQCDRGTKNESF